VTVPLCDATMTCGPSIAGEDGSVPPTRRRQCTLPVSASIEYVAPSKVFTYRSPSQ
jgi:hypothetical protein